MDVVVEKSQYEIERGKPMPSKNHSFIQKRVVKLVDRKYPDKYEILPELSLDLKIEGREKVPDLAIFKYDDISFDADKDEIRVEQIPLGVIEIMSPSQNLTELLIKSHTYFEAGIKSYWLIIPPLRTVYVFSDKSEYEVFLKNDLLKDEQLNIELDLGKLFAK